MRAKRAVIFHSRNSSQSVVRLARVRFNGYQEESRPRVGSWGEPALDCRAYAQRERPDKPRSRKQDPLVFSHRYQSCRETYVLFQSQTNTFQE